MKAIFNAFFENEEERYSLIDLMEKIIVKYGLSRSIGYTRADTIFKLHRKTFNNSYSYESVIKQLTIFYKYKYIDLLDCFSMT